MLPLHPEHKKSFLLGGGVNRLTIYPKSRFCTKTHKTLTSIIFCGISGGFSRLFGVFQTFLRNAEKENCKFGARKCDSLLEVFLSFQIHPCEKVRVFRTRSFFVHHTIVFSDKGRECKNRQVEKSCRFFCIFSQSFSLITERQYLRVASASGA